MPLASLADVSGIEESIEHAVQSGDASPLPVIGYGEISVALKLSTHSGDFVCKRLVPVESRELAEQTAQTIHTYIDRLSDRGFDVVPTETPILERPEGHVLYCVQPMLNPGTLGPDFLRGKPKEEGVRHVERIFELIQRAVSPTLAPDGQLSNWAFDGDRLRYLDVGTPFMRDADGNELFDFTQQTRALPGPIRVIVDRFLIKGILDNYYTTRGQALDFLGNLIKEGLPELIEPLIEIANRVFELESPITAKETDAHYRSDAQTYAFIQAARRADRWWHQKLLHKPYPYILPPRIERYH